MTRVAPEAVRVPLLDLWDVHGSLREELLHDFERVLRSGQFILGPELDGFEAELAAWSGVRHAVGLASGTAALSLALQALGVGPGDEVVVPAFTYIASATSVTGIGAKPVFVDVEPDRMGLDPGRLADSVSVRTKAVMVVHLYGLSAA
ncbi:MAG TPA: aminotransferase class I/II-fold pyridoxal phosphate-dependent enzyme, partial [Candidatus Eisenbacteria bacterium]